MEAYEMNLFNSYDTIDKHTYLMCKNKKVYCIDTQSVLCKELLPGIMQKKPCSASFKQWLKYRYSSGTNSLARQLKGVVFGQGNRVIIDRETKAFSLSDCYWLSDGDEIFEELSPYYKDFWKGERDWDGSSIPTLYVNGALSKQWINSNTLEKVGELQNEIDAIRLCEHCGVSVNKANASLNGIYLTNFTSPDFMLEAADASGRFDEDYYTNEDIVREFGVDGVRMIVIDAITGNGDRHLGNFGWLRDTETGAYVRMAPLYDFDHALDAQRDKDILLSEAIRLKDGFADEAIKIARKAMTFEHPIFSMRAKIILEA